MSDHVKTLKDRYGADYFKKLGAKGGRKGKGHMFAHGHADPRKAGKVGGTISRKLAKKASGLIDKYKEE